MILLLLLLISCLSGITLVTERCPEIACRRHGLLLVVVVLVVMLRLRPIVLEKDLIWWLYRLLQKLSHLLRLHALPCVSFR